MNLNIKNMDENGYKETLAQFSHAVNLGIKISNLAANRQAKEDKIYWTCILYTKMCVTSISILILCPESEIAEKRIPHWDFSSLFSLTRNLMECYQTLFYLCIDNVSEDELRARRKLFNLHDYYSRHKLFSFIEFDNRNLETEQTLIRELRDTTFFQSLEEKQQKHFLKGDNAFFISREDIEERSGTHKNKFKFFYKLFSSNTHSLPMGFYGMFNGDRGRGIKTETEVGYSIIALGTADQYIRQATNHMLYFFPDILQQLTEAEKTLLLNAKR